MVGKYAVGKVGQKPKVGRGCYLKRRDDERRNADFRSDELIGVETRLMFKLLQMPTLSHGVLRESTPT